MSRLSSLNLHEKCTVSIYARTLINSHKQSFDSTKLLLPFSIRLMDLESNSRSAVSVGVAPLFFAASGANYSRLNSCVTSYFPGMVNLIHTNYGGKVTLGVKAKFVLFMCEFFKYNWWFQTSLLIDICASDYISRLKRFEVVYCLISVTRNERLYLRVFTDELTPLPSVSKLFKSAGWLEREA